MKKTLLAGLCAALLLLAACGQAAAPASTPTPTPAPEGTVAPTATPAPAILGDFAATDLAGNAVDETVFAAHTLTMVNVWATYCGPCLQEMPDLGELAEEYADRGVRVVGLVVDVLDADGAPDEGQIGTALDIVDSTGADYLHIVPSADLYGLLSQITAVPTTLFVDASGAQVGRAYVGARDKDGWAEIVEGMLEEVA